MIQSSQHSITTTAAEIVATSQVPKRVIIHAENSATVYIGGSNAVTGTTGLLVDKAGGPIVIQIDSDDSLWAIAKTGTHIVTVLEVFL